jgi:hypothetical protein
MSVRNRAQTTTVKESDMVAKIKTNESTSADLEHLIEEHWKIVDANRKAHPRFAEEFDELILSMFDPEVLIGSRDWESGFEEIEDDQVNGR